MGFQSISARTGVQGRSANREPVASSDGKLKGVDVLGDVCVCYDGNGVLH